MRSSPIILAAALLVCGCSRHAPERPAAPVSGTPAASQAVTPAAAPRGQPREVTEKNALIDFAYAYPAQADAIPALKEIFETDLVRQKAALTADARDQKAEAARSGFPYHALGDWVTWKVVADLPDWLSLSAEVGTYEGGAHPNHGFDALLWDRRANARRAPIDLFISKAALSRAIRKDFCAALDRQRANKRGAAIRPGSTDAFDQCIDPAESTLILGSSNHASFDRIGVLVAPYAAGPYVEGDYEVTLPVTAAVLATVKPEYRSSFALGH
jgi:hypothetical protein